MTMNHARPKQRPDCIRLRALSWSIEPPSARKRSAIKADDQRVDDGLAIRPCSLEIGKPVLRLASIKDTTGDSLAEVTRLSEEGQLPPNGCQRSSVQRAI